MKNTTNNIKVRASRVPDCWNETFIWTVFNNGATVSITEVERLPEWTENTKKHFEGLGWKVITVEDDGRFAAKFTVTLEKQIPEMTEFKTRFQAEKFARTLGWTNN